MNARAEPTGQDELPQPTAQRLPRWRGFNLTEKINAGSQRPFAAADFQWIAELGFNFVRLPMDYRCWTDADDPHRVREGVLAEIDQAVELGRACGLHVCLNLHRAPGYTVAKGEPEGLCLWTDEQAQEQFDFQWSMFARRYRGIDSSRLSFNLVNEPGTVAAGAYASVVRRVVAAIRREDPDRLVIADGLWWGNVPATDLADLGIAQSTRGYTPAQVSHYRANWVNSEGWPEPTWPLEAEGELWDRDRLGEEQIRPWKELESRGVGVHVGEFGCYRYTPHDVALRWMRDFLSLWNEAGWGSALWNFRGSFGILDSGREDVDYETFHGHQLDRAMLDLLREF